MDVRVFQEKILSYYHEHGRVLPWRQTTDPWAILVSEIMLQQTQVDRVIVRYQRWLQKWPTPQALASVSKEDVLREWMGLGYNRRALFLWEAAKRISQEFQGDTIRALDHKLPGVGPYTVRAVRIFSQNQDLATVDTNIRRILLHEFQLPEATSEKDLWALAERCVPPGRSRDWHNALMDYGQLLTSRASGIRPKTRQSRFEGSDRQIRAKILRLALQKKLISLETVCTHFPGIDSARLESILETLVNDAMLIREGKNFRVG